MAKPRLVMTLGIVGSCVVLSACSEPYGLGPNALSRSGETLLIAVCAPINATEIYAESQSGENSTVFLDLGGEASLQVGDIVDVAAGVPGLDGDLQPIPLTGVESIVLKFEGDGGVGQSWNSVFIGDPVLAIPSDGWLHTDGVTTSQPCR